MRDEPEPNTSPEAEPVPATPSPDESPFPTPPLEPAEKGGEPPTEHRSRADNVQLTSDINPEESPFETPAIEGLPFERDSEEAHAIRRVIEESEAERHKQRSRLTAD
jgi:hypothetical protein